MGPSPVKMLVLFREHAALHVKVLRGFKTMQVGRKRGAYFMLNMNNHTGYTDCGKKTFTVRNLATIIFSK